VAVSRDGCPAEDAVPSALAIEASLDAEQIGKSTVGHRGVISVTI
jgi:hypothetical protein